MHDETEYGQENSVVLQVPGVQVVPIGWEVCYSVVRRC
jgi:hypothetical protein